MSGPGGRPVGPPGTGLVALHGGVGEEPTEAFLHGLHTAARAAVAPLSRSAVDAVVEAVAVLEDDEEFNAGRGAVLNALGRCEVDASVVDGAAARWAGVGALPDTQHPVRVAHRLLRRDTTVLLVGDGAARFARDNDFPAAELRTPRRREQWQRRCLAPAGTPTGCDTVGCIAVDEAGRIAAASSSGGLTGKPPGRLGDAAIVGAGLYADTDTAVICTGEGEAALTTTTALRAALRCHDDDAAAAAGWAVDAATAVHSELGIIVYDHRRGQLAVRHNSTHFTCLVYTGGRGLLLTPERGEVKLWPVGTPAQ